MNNLVIENETHVLSIEDFYNVINNPLEIIRLCGNVRPLRFTMEEYALDSMKSILAHILNHSIDSINPRYYIGNVYSFDITPKRHPDPNILYCRMIDLTQYYKLWDFFINNRRLSFYNYEHGIHREEWDNMMRRFALSMRDGILSPEEHAFVLMEMLKFKNEVILDYY